MKNQTLTAIAGFLILFFLYHAAEYMILFKNSAAGFLAFQLLFFVVAFLLAKWQRKQGLAAWGLAFDKTFLPHLVLGLVTGILFYGITFLVSCLAGIEKIVAVPGFSQALAPLGLFIFGNFFSSFSEDVLTRGYVYNHLKGKISPLLFMLISAAIYLLNHIYRLNDGIITCFYLFLLGVLYVVPLIVTGRLWFTGGMHWAGNVTFYYTHEIIKTEETSGPITSNHILILATVVFIPLNYFMLRKTKLAAKN